MVDTSTSGPFGIGPPPALPAKALSAVSEELLDLPTTVLDARDARTADLAARVLEIEARMARRHDVTVAR